MSTAHRAAILSGLGLVAALALGSLACAQTGGPTNGLPNPYRTVRNYADASRSKDHQI